MLAFLVTLFVSMLDPIVLVLGIGAGFVSRRWWVVLPLAAALRIVLLLAIPPVRQDAQLLVAQVLGMVLIAAITVAIRKARAKAPRETSGV